MRVKVEVEIPDGWELAGDNMRQVCKGEWYLDSYWKANFWDRSYHSDGKYVILKKKEVKKLTLTHNINWIAMDEGGWWYGYIHKPKLQSNRWLESPTPAFESQAQYLHPELWNLPKCDDWKQSLHYIGKGEPE